MFFDRFREALGRLPAGLVRPGPPAVAAEVAQAEAELGERLPADYASFLRSFDGADLFHESIVIAGVGPHASRRLLDLNGDRAGHQPLVFAETSDGDRFALDGAGRVLRLPTGAEERWLSGSSFGRWLDARLAHDRVLYGPDGEFSPDAFTTDGEVEPVIALRQAERALRADPEAAEHHHEAGVALRRLGRGPEARAAFAEAARLDATNPWAWFNLGRAALDLGPAGARQALEAFQTAAENEAGVTAARLWVWGARAAALAAQPERMVACRARARAAAGGIEDELRRAIEATRDDAEDAGESGEATALLEALVGPIPAGRARLAVVDEERGPRGPGPRGGAPEGASSRKSGAPAGASTKPVRRHAKARPPKKPSVAPESPTRRTPRPPPRRPGPAARPPTGGRRRGPRR